MTNEIEVALLLFYPMGLQLTSSHPQFAWNLFRFEEVLKILSRRRNCGKIRTDFNGCLPINVKPTCHSMYDHYGGIRPSFLKSACFGVMMLDSRQR
jgi:hypothetical protein